MLVISLAHVERNARSTLRENCTRHRVSESDLHSRKVFKKKEEKVALINDVTIDDFDETSYRQREGLFVSVKGEPYGESSPPGETFP